MKAPEEGFEPSTSSLGGKRSIQAELLEQSARDRIRTCVRINHESLNLARLTTPAPLHEISKFFPYKKLYKFLFSSFFEDSHSELETPVPLPNTEVKLLTLLALVADQLRTLQAVFLIFVLITFIYHKIFFE